MSPPAPPTPPVAIPETSPHKERVGLAALVTVVCWASAFIGIRSAAGDFGPGPLALLRMATGTVCLGAIAAHRGLHLPRGRAALGVVVWGVAWFCFYNVALNSAERVLDAGTSAMLVNLAPLLVVLIAGVLLREGYPPSLVVGAPVSFLGVVLIGLHGSHGTVTTTGLLLALAAAVLYAGCTLLQKQLLRTVDAASLTFIGAAAGTVALLPWSGELVQDLGSAKASSIGWVVYLGVFSTAVAFSTWAYVLQRVSAGRTAATTYVVPAVTIVLSWLILHETPAPVVLLGGGLCLLGVFITRRPTRRKVSPPAP